MRAPCEWQRPLCSDLDCEVCNRLAGRAEAAIAAGQRWNYQGLGPAGGWSPWEGTSPGPGPYD